MDCAVIENCKVATALIVFYEAKLAEVAADNEKLMAENDLLKTHIKELTEELEKQYDVLMTGKIVSAAYGEEETD
ncbi:MAG TPA: hypothetical protein DEQ02_08090 [Ruminococcaceae bacterium]|nr:hypothetical protein [Oscillospiraceae bacterium]